MWTTNRTNVQKRKSAPSHIINTSSSAASLQSKKQSLSRLSNGIIRRKDHSNNTNNSNKGTNIQVVLRCRGRNEAELAADSPVILEATGRREVLLTTSNKIFTFDRVFDENATQDHIYTEVVQPILDQVLEGFNCTIFAYGQTGSGKTYTMEGNLDQHTTDAGIIPRVINKLFETLDTKKTEYSIKVSLLELYNEELRDLLNPSNNNNSQHNNQSSQNSQSGGGGSGRQIKIFEDKIGSGVVIQGVEEKYIQSATEGLDVLKSGIKYRSIGATKCNDKSSRSHCIFSVIVHIRESIPGSEDIIRIGKLNLVDLAGSENINRSGAELVRAREAGMINQSLLTLGRVINHLVEESAHIPYRESKLTRLLKDSLGGKTRTCIIATVSIAKINQEEIISTLDYANRAKNIRNKPEANHPTNRNVYISDLEMKIEQLKGDLQASYDKNGVYMTHKSYEAMKDENQHLRDAVKEKQDQLDKYKHELIHSESKMKDITMKMESIIKDCDYKIEKIKMEEQEARSQQEAGLLDYIKKMESNIRNLHKEVVNTGKRNTQLHQRHMDNDHEHLIKSEEQIDKWKSLIDGTMLDQIKRLKEQNKKQEEILRRERESEEKVWDKLEQLISDLSRNRKSKLDNTFASLNKNWSEHIDDVDTLYHNIEAENKNYTKLFKAKKEEVDSMKNEIKSDQDDYKKILEHVLSLSATNESQYQLLQNSDNSQDKGIRKRKFDESEKSPLVKKKPNR